MTLQDKLLLVYTVATVIQVVVVAVTVFFIHRQAREARRTVENIEETARLNVYLNHRRDAQVINRLLLHDSDLSGLLGYEKKDILAFIFIGHAEMMFRQRQDSTVTEEVWRSMLQLIEKIFNMGFVVQLWRDVKTEYTPDFVSFIEGLPSVGSSTLCTNTQVPSNKTDAADG